MAVVGSIAQAGPPFAEFVDPNPNPGNLFGHTVVALSTGNVVITSPLDDAGGTNAGAVYLFNGATGELISTLTGSKANDNVGNGGVTALSNGNYVVCSFYWHNGAAADAGAVTWGSGTTGVSGVVSSSNSLVGSKASDVVGNLGVTALSNGNYVVHSTGWDNGAAADAGAVTWGSGTTGVSGVVSSSNSLVGSTTNDQVGYSGVTALSNGNYVVRSQFWDNGASANAGAVTWGSGSTGIIGTVSSSNSLVGSTAGDSVGSGVTALSNGHYVVNSASWDNGAATDAGAVTWGNGTTGVSGVISSSNSLVGSTANDYVGGSGVTTLSNGNYVVCSSYWDNGAATSVGAVTWGSGSSGVSGVISSSNSLVGSTAGDSVGNGGVAALSNGHYVVRSYSWDNGAVTDAGAVTWCNGTTGLSGVINSSNSLVGSTANDNVGGSGVEALNNGNYVVSSYSWNNGAVIDAGAVTWGSGTTGLSGVVSSSNSLVGSTTNDYVGIGGVTALSNGNYVVCSPYWDNGAINSAGAVTWGSGTTGVSGVVSSSNSLVGSKDSDFVGNLGVTTLSNGNYVVRSPNWDNGAINSAGAVTWGSGSSGVSGVVSSSNSLVGSTVNDNVGIEYYGVTALSNGNYVVCSLYWDNGAVVDAGAVTWGSGTAGVSGVVSSSNSLVGSTAIDQVGNNGVTALNNGNYVVSSYSWDNGAINSAGAATWGSGTAGVSGVINSGNSLVGLTSDANFQTVVLDDVNGTFLGRFIDEGSGKVRVGSQETGVVPSLAVTSVAPPSGSTTGGTSVTITGTGFTGAIAVSFGGTAAAAFTVNNDTSITATTPAHTAGAVSVEFTTVGGTNAANTLYTYLVPPTISVTGNGIPIAHDDTSPSGTDETDFGNVLVTNTQVTRTFTISNAGDVALNLTGTPKVAISGTHAADFAVTTEPTTPVATSGGSSTFMVTFDPSGLGTRSATVTVASDDPATPAYTFAIQGEGTAPEFHVLGNNQPITNGDTLPSSADHTDIGQALLVGGTAARTFTITNSGTAVLNLTGTPKVAISGTHAAEFTVTAEPSTPVAAGGASTTFIVTFDPSQLGLRQATVSIESDDSDSSPFTFDISGYGLSTPLAQTITFPELPSKLTTDTPFELGATVSSGLAVTYSIVSPAGIATVAGDTISLSGAAGAVTVRASQPGDATHHPALEVYRTFTVLVASERFVKLARGSNAYHSAGIRADGTLWLWGRNGDGQLGDGSTISRTTPAEVAGAATWTTVASGLAHTVAVRSDGTLWAWGSNGAGQLGVDVSFFLPQREPVPVGDEETTWASVACGPYHTLAVRMDGTLRAWVKNDASQLGDGTTTRRNSPVQVGSEATWASVATGYAHTVAVRTDGTLWAWGNNEANQIGDGTVINRSSPVQVGSGTTWASVACGNGHTMAVRTDGTLWAWGDNGQGQLGDGTTTNRSSPVQVGDATTWGSVACGYSHTVAVRNDGTLWAAGYNGDGQLGDGTLESRLSLAQVGSGMSWASVSCGHNHTLALRTDGTLWAWGSNSDGQVGDQDTILPVRVWPERGTQTLNFPVLSALIPGQSTVLTASASSGLPVTYTVVGSATVNGSTLTAVGAGTIQVTAFQQGNEAWQNAESVSQSVLVMGPVMGLLGNSNLIANGDMAPRLEDHTEFGTVVLLNAQVTRTFTITNAGTDMLNLTGTPRVVISGAAAGDFTVAKLPLSPVAVSGSTTFAITFDPKLPGLRQATVSVESDDVDSTPFTFAISGYGGLSTLLAQTITFTPPTTVYLGQSPLALTAYASSGLPVTLSVVSGGAFASLSGNALTLNAAGTVKVTATQLGSGNYKAAVVVTKTIVVKINPTALTLINLNQTYDGTAKAIGSIPAADAITYKRGAAYVPDVPTVAGSYPVKAVLGTKTVTGTLVIAKAPLFVTPVDQRKFAGLPNPTLLPPVITGFQNGETAAVFTKAPALKTTATMTSAGGLYPITASGGVAANYTFIYRQGTLVVESFAGNYEALLVDGTPPLPLGKLSLTVAATSKTFTGKLYTSTETVALSLLSTTLTTNPGTELATGIATVTKNNIPYVVDITLPLHGDVLATVTRNGLPLGTANDGRKLSTQTVTYGGAHTAVLEPALPASSTVPAGAGWATASISTKGVLTLTGKLGDGVAFSSVLTPDVDSDPGYRLFAQPYKTGTVLRLESYIAGAFSLAAHPTLTNRRYLEQAPLTWKKTGAPLDATYRTTFGLATTVMMIDPWQKPVAATKTVTAITLPQRLGLTGSSFGIGHSDTLSLSNGNLPTRVALSVANAVSVTTPPANLTKWKTLTFNTATGTFTGSFELMDTIKRAVTFSGVLRQPATALDALIGDGHYLLPPLTGTEKTTGEVQFTRP